MNFFSLVIWEFHTVYFHHIPLILLLLPDPSPNCILFLQLFKIVLKLKHNRTIYPLPCPSSNLSPTSPTDFQHFLHLLPTSYPFLPPSLSNWWFIFDYYYYTFAHICREKSITTSCFIHSVWFVSIWFQADHFLLNINNSLWVVISCL